MGLRYSFRHLFFGGKLNKKRLYKILEDLDAANGGETIDISALKTTVGDTNSGLVKDTSALKTTVGDAESGLVKDTSALKTTVGDAESGLVKSVADIETAIGDESTEGSILARIKALEDAE